MDWRAIKAGVLEGWEQVNDFLDHIGINSDPRGKLKKNACWFLLF